jgi:hypothetical protein
MEEVPGEHSNSQPEERAEQKPEEQATGGAELFWRALVIHSSL